MSSALPPASAAADIAADAQTKIDHIVAMGFSRAEVETCMRAASNDTDTAIEFLLGGIPARQIQGHVPPPPPPSGDAQTKIDHIVAMGFNRAEVETCMRAASNDTDTAIEFLLGGIPASGLRTHVEAAAPASSTSPSTEHICTRDLAGEFSVIGSTADAYRELLQRIESSDPTITKLRLAGTALAPWKGEASDVECTDFRVKFHRFSTVRGAEFHRCESRAYYEIEVKRTCPGP